jgi:hypothetical protein
MAEIAEVHLRGDDPGRGVRLARLISAQTARERAAEARRAWTSVVAATSLVASWALLVPEPAVARVSLGLAAAALAATVRAAMSEWKCARVVRRALLESGARVLRCD